MALSDTDHALLLRAVDLAQGSIGLSDPNPRVGCVLHDAAGQLAGEGFTQQAGGPHAEVMALQAAAQAGRPVAGGTAWVSLEPCAHHGRTPPCADALIAAGLARVVIATSDPFPQVAGQGIARLRAAGVRVDLAEPGPTRRAAQEMNIGFFSRVLRRRPWVRMKAAASLDGRTALPDGTSQWITGEAARRDGHAWRRRAGAVLTGIGTVRRDDPQLDVRWVPTHHQPLRVVVDSGFTTSPRARLLQSPGRVLVVGAREEPERMAALRAAGAEVLLLPVAIGGSGRVDLPALIARLAADGVNELHVEAGATLNAALLASGQVDELLLYLAPMLVGPGLDIAALPTLQALSQAVALRFDSVQRVGSDLCVRARTIDADTFLQA
jgi:diaminohydroxyphosphoribosylaminopyrimidine deaminase/5-amino-6-(5-phosphoribosylamino)uracil reductase